MRRHKQNSQYRQKGFSLVEVLVATMILFVGIIAVAKLVPLAVGLNSGNRADSTALVIAQREMDGLITQPLTSTTFSDPQGVLCPALTVCNLGSSALANTVVGSPLIAASNPPRIDFTAGKVAGYNFTYQDPDDPGQAAYDVRWAVITLTGNYGKRFIVGVRGLGTTTPFLPVTLDTVEEK
ncbi:MAG TPA: prepilin-type N-terminal cleavage/methylation domain-containing protein [Candidatus Acidoferrales bacterium]|nr:prepilin-type N-terminal cleavage/methylation domain-containing protein [Candidatus Acidoferrales bacterium]